MSRAAATSARLARARDTGFQQRRHGFGQRAHQSDQTALLLSAIGRPMMPRPTNPIFHALLPPQKTGLAAPRGSEGNQRAAGLTIQFWNFSVSSSNRAIAVTAPLPPPLG